MATHGMDRWGRDAATDWGRDAGPGVMAPPPLTSSGELLRTPVINRHGQWLGELQDLVLDAQAGTIVYAIVTVPTQQESKRFAVPWAALEHDAEQARLMWDVERQALERSPGLPPGVPEDADSPRDDGVWPHEPYERRDRL